MHAKMAHAMSGESYQHDSSACLGNQLVQDLVNATDGKSGVRRPGPDDLHHRSIVADQTIHCGHDSDDFAPSSEGISLECLRQNPSCIPIEKTFVACRMDTGLGFLPSRQAGVACCCQVSAGIRALVVAATSS